MRNTKLHEFEPLHIDDATRQDMLYAGELFEELNEEYFRRLDDKSSKQRHWSNQRKKAIS